MKKGQVIGTSSAAYPTQSRRESASTGRGELRLALHACSPSGKQLVRRGRVFCRGQQAAALYVAGVLGSGLCRSVAGTDRSACRGGQCGVVQHAHLGGSRLQGYQTRRLAVAANQDERPSAGQSLVVS